MIAREKRRRRLAARYRAKRAALLLQMKTPGGGGDEHVRDAMLQLQQLPRDSSRARQRNRCQASGRPRGYYRKFGLARNKLREVIMRGEAPGVVKASW